MKTVYALLLSLFLIGSVKAQRIEPVNQINTSAPGPLAKKPAITLQDVKNLIAFDHTKGIGLTLVNMVDVWYAIAKESGKSEQEAIRYAVDELAKKINEMASRL